MKKGVLIVSLVFALAVVSATNYYETAGYGDRSGQIYHGPGMRQTNIYHGPGMNEVWGMSSGGSGNNANNKMYFNAWLNGDGEVPSTDTYAAGMGTFVLNTRSNTLKFNINYTNLESPETMAHIHGPAMPGQSAPPVFTLPMGMKKKGMWHYDEQWEDDIIEGRMYVNVHSQEYPNGEIRGQFIKRD